MVHGTVNECPNGCCTEVKPKLAEWQRRTRAVVEANRLELAVVANRGAGHFTRIAGVLI